MEKIKFCSFVIISSLLVYSCGTPKQRVQSSSAKVSAPAAAVSQEPQDPSVPVPKTLEDFQADPLYPQFQRDLADGILAIDRDAAASGINGHDVISMADFIYTLAISYGPYYDFCIQDGTVAIEQSGVVAGLGLSQAAVDSIITTEIQILAAQ